MKLIPAFAADAARLTAAYHEFIVSPRAVDFMLVSWLSGFRPPENDWESIARVVVRESDGAYIGYLSARIDRDCREVTQLVAARFDAADGSDIAWSMTLRTWMLGLIDQFEVIHWTARRGTHNAEMWTRAAIGLGGRVVGYHQRAGRTPRGELIDVELYEVLGRGGRGAGPVVRDDPG